jgi:RNA polymerase primary sigma factor
MRQLKVNQSVTSRESRAVNAHLADISRRPLLTVEQEIELAQKARQGDQEALKKLVEGNLRFVISVAKQYQSKGLELADLISEGEMGLIKAAQKFDETRGFKFISYAVWWIRQSILQASAEYGDSIRIPLNGHSDLNRVGKFSAEFEQENYRKPTIEEISEGLGLDEAKVKRTLQAASKIASLDAKFDDDDDGTLMDVLPGADTPDTDSVLMNESLSQDIRRVLMSLDERDRKIVCMAYGIGCEERTHAEIGERVGLSPERVRQILIRSIKRLRNNSKSKLLKNYLH